MISNKEIVALEFNTPVNSSWSDFEVKALLKKLSVQFEEAFVLRTCQRLFIAVYAHHSIGLEVFLENQGLRSATKHFRKTKETARHLFQLAGGLKSKLLGEHEILGQLKKHLKIAEQAETLGPHLSTLLCEAIHCGKQIRHQTDIGSHNITYESVGTSLAYAIHQTYQLHYLIIGTGTIAQNILKFLDKKDAASIHVASHDLPRARQLTEEYSGTPVLIENIQPSLTRFNVIFGCSDSELIFTDRFEEKEYCPRYEITEIPGSPLIIDYGAPPNFPQMQKFDIQNYYGLEFIYQLANENLDARKKEVPKANAIVEELVEKFYVAFNERKAGKILGGFWLKLKNVEEKELNWLFPKLEGVTEETRLLIKKFSHRLLREIARDPMLHIRGLAGEVGDNRTKLQLINKVLNQPNNNNYGNSDQK